MLKYSFNLFFIYCFHLKLFKYFSASNKCFDNIWNATPPLFLIVINSGSLTSLAGTDVSLSHFFFFFKLFSYWIDTKNNKFFWMYLTLFEISFNKCLIFAYNCIIQSYSNGYSLILANGTLRYVFSILDLKNS